METTFSKGIPTGPYRTYFHPRGQSGLSKEDLLEEEGRFDEMGRLVGNQVCYYPRTEGLMVYLPNNQPLETVHEPTPHGLSKAIDECYLAISEIPPTETLNAYPPKFFASIKEEAKLLRFGLQRDYEAGDPGLWRKHPPDRFDANYESYRIRAVKQAKELTLTYDLSEGNQAPVALQSNSPIEIIALNDRGEVVDILWSTFSKKTRSISNQESLKKKENSPVLGNWRIDRFGMVHSDRAKFGHPARPRRPAKRSIHFDAHPPLNRKIGEHLVTQHIKRSALRNG